MLNGEHYSAKDYFDCNKAIIITDGNVIENAKNVAKKLNIEITDIPSEYKKVNNDTISDSIDSFENIWEKYIMPLQGQTLFRENGKSNQILKVDWSGIERETSNGRKQKIKIEIFKLVINYLLKHGEITRANINQEYSDRASSGIILILSSIPIIEKYNNPMRIKLSDR